MVTVHPESKRRMNLFSIRQRRNRLWRLILCLLYVQHLQGKMNIFFYYLTIFKKNLTYIRHTYLTTTYHHRISDVSLLKCTFIKGNFVLTLHSISSYKKRWSILMGPFLIFSWILDGFRFLFSQFPMVSVS